MIVVYIIVRCASWGLCVCVFSFWVICLCLERVFVACVVWGIWMYGVQFQFINSINSIQGAEGCALLGGDLLRSIYWRRWSRIPVACVCSDPRADLVCTTQNQGKICSHWGVASTNKWFEGNWEGCDRSSESSPVSAASTMSVSWTPRSASCPERCSCSWSSMCSSARSPRRSPHLKRPRRRRRRPPTSVELELSSSGFEKA